jgi:hypothetical protein
MTAILRVFQIKTFRSAWSFLIFSCFLFVLGLFYFFSASNLGAEFVVSWLILVGLYVVIAAWALFSTTGKEYLQSQEDAPLNKSKGVLWYPKFLFACYAAGFATMFFLAIAVLPIFGTYLIIALFEPGGAIYILAAGAIWSPLVFKHLK